MDADGKLNCSLDLSLKLQIVKNACTCDQKLVSVEFDSQLIYILAYVMRAHSIILSCNVLFTVELGIYSYYLLNPCHLDPEEQNSTTFQLISFTFCFVGASCPLFEQQGKLFSYIDILLTELMKFAFWFQKLKTGQTLLTTQ